MLTYYAFIIDTNKYAGNFEGHMCAYCTGITGNCEVGSKQASIFRNEISSNIQDEFEDIVMQKPDEYDCWRPCKMWLSSDSVSYNSVAIFFEDEPSKKLIEIMKTRSKTYSNNNRIIITGFRLIKINEITKYTNLKV